MLNNTGKNTITLKPMFFSKLIVVINFYLFRALHWSKELAMEDTTTAFEDDVLLGSILSNDGIDINTEFV